MDLQEAPAATVGRPRGHRTGMERFLIGLTVVLLVSSVVLVASLVYVVSSGTDEEAGAGSTQVAERNRSQGGLASPRTMGQATVPEQFQGDLCVTPGCVSVASHLLRSRDPSISPCDDFFLHACGGWQRRASQLGLADSEADYSVNIDQPQAAVDWKLLQLLSSPKQETVHGFWQTKRFFNFCKKHLPAAEEDLEWSADHILQHELGGFRSAVSWAVEPVQLTELLVQLHRLQAGPLFQLYRAVDPRDHSRRVVMVSLPDSDPMKHAAERRHRPRRQPSGSPWLTHHTMRPFRRRRRVGPVPTEDFDPMNCQINTASDEMRGSMQAPMPSANFFRTLKNSVVCEHIDGSMYFFARSIANTNDSDYYSEERMVADWNGVHQFLRNFSKILPSQRDQAELEINSQLQCHHQMTVGELQLEFPSVNWTYLLRETVAPDITESERVCLPFRKYLADLDLMLAVFSPHIVHNAALLLYRKTRLESMVSTLSAAHSSDQASSQYCLGLVQTLFPVPLAGMFVRDAGRARVDALKVKVSALVSEIRDELVRALKKRDAQTPSPVNKMALEKLRRMRIFIGASDSFWDDRFINEHTPSGVVRRLRSQGSDEYRLLRLIRALASPERNSSDQYLAADYRAEDTIWTYVIQPYSANGFYLLDRNAMVMPLAFLSEPYLYDDVPRYITLAALGTVVAHELLHSIGVSGFYFDGDGELRDLSESTERQLSELRHCVRHHFTRNLSREVEFSGLHVTTQPSGELTLDENLSDHDGLALAWRTYHRWQHRHRQVPEPRLPGVQTSVRQTFLLALTQTYCAKVAAWSYITSAEVDAHLPNPERITAQLRQFPGFAAAFGCSVGAPMRPEHQCSPLWISS